MIIFVSDQGTILNYCIRLKKRVPVLCTLGVKHGNMYYEMDDGNTSLCIRRLGIV